MATPTITDVSSTEILDNRLEPTLRVTVRTESSVGRADVPRGRSRGENEVNEIRDGTQRYRGNGVRSAVRQINDVVRPALRDTPVIDQRNIDRTLVRLDGEGPATIIGGNSTTGVSLAVAKAAAAAVDQPLYRYIGGVRHDRLPVPFLDVIEGGELGASGLAFQEHQIVPVAAESFSAAIRYGAETYYELGDILETKYGKPACAVGDEGGYCPASIDDAWEAFDVIMSAIEAAGHTDRIALAADVAASHLYDTASEEYRLDDGLYTREQLFDYYADLLETFPIVSLEDPLVETDFQGTARMTDRFDCQIVGDDLFVTDSNRVRTGLEFGAGTALLLKVNQVGTVTGAIEAANVAREGGLRVQVSERSGQTADTWLADLAVGLGARQIKTGVTRSERTEQYNRLMAIERELGPSAEFGDPSLTEMI